MLDDISCSSTNEDKCGTIYEQKSEMSQEFWHQVCARSLEKPSFYAPMLNMGWLKFNGKIDARY